jgi:hypothetical protein
MSNDKKLVLLVGILAAGIFAAAFAQFAGRAIN